MSFPGDDELTLRKTMKQTYLIQRLEKPYQMQLEGKTFDNPFSFGGGLKNGGLSDNAMDLIRDIFSFDYMGSAEFEFGAVPQALSFLAKQSYAHNLFNEQVELSKGEIVYYLSPLEYEPEVINRIKILRTGKMQLKERCGLDYYFDSQREYAKRTCGWLELDNGFMFFTDKEMFDKTCNLFGVSNLTPN